MNTSEDFVNRLKAWMESHGLHQGQVADKLGVSRPYLNQLLKGRREPGAALVRTFDRLQEIPDVNYGGFSLHESEQQELEKAQLDVIAATKLRIEARALREMAARLEQDAAEFERRAGLKPNP